MPPDFKATTAFIKVLVVNPIKMGPTASALEILLAANRDAADAAVACAFYNTAMLHNMAEIATMPMLSRNQARS